MNIANQLPELPTPKYIGTIRGVPCITLTEHEHLMRAYALQAIAQATQAEVTDEQILAAGREWSKEQGWWDFEVNDFLGCARAILALRPERVPMTERELELIDGMIAVQLGHAQRCDAISNRDMAEKQKGWDMERVELLRRIRSLGITAHAQKGTNGEIS